MILYHGNVSEYGYTGNMEIVEVKSHTWSEEKLHSINAKGNAMYSDAALC